MSNFSLIKSGLKQSEIYEFTAQGHELLNMIESSEKTIIALTTGLALGGGLELALPVIIVSETDARVFDSLEQVLAFTLV